MGSTETHRAVVHQPRTLEQLRAVFERAGPAGLALMGAGHSFGEHFLPVPGGEVVDTKGLGGELVWLGPAAPRRWARVPGSFSFEALAAAAPGYLPRHPPTSDRITLAGALAACTHDSIGYFAERVRRFQLLTPDGVLHDCHADAPGLAGELFRLLPGSFGTLGVVLQLEIELDAVDSEQAVEIHVHRESYREDPRLLRLARLAADPTVRGAGSYVYGVGGTMVTFEGRVVASRSVRELPPLPLTDDATTRNVYLQGAASLWPRLTNVVSRLMLVEGRRYRAPLYGHAFFQRSYGRAYGVLGSDQLLARGLRRLGMDPRLPVAHQTFVIPPDRVEVFLNAYFARLASYPELVPRIEQQDLIRVPAARWPLHACFGMQQGAFMLTTSLGIARDARRAVRASELLARIADEGAQSGVKTLLLKQMHGTAALLRRSHAGALRELAQVKARVDPRGLLRTRWLHTLLPELD